MSKQAKNFIELCRGNSYSSIEQAVKMVKQSVYEELLDYFRVSSAPELIEALQ